MRLKAKTEIIGDAAFIVSQLFERELKRRFWWGVMFGIILMAASDITDLHLCIGECDNSGLSLLEIGDD